MKELNNGFVRTMFWVLILGSFSWTTLVGVGLLKVAASNDNVREAEDTALEIRLAQRIERNQVKMVENQEKVMQKFEDIHKEMNANQTQILKEIKKIQ